MLASLIMKPPARRRSAPARYVTPGSSLKRAAPIRLAWTYREKVKLLKGLRAERSKIDPEPQVKGRSKTEVSSYISWLRGRAAREAAQTEYEKWVREKKPLDIRNPAPIELWEDLACRMSDLTEEAVSTAFSQMLTIAATEPLSLKHSVPSKESQEEKLNVFQSEGQDSANSGQTVQKKRLSEETSNSSGPSGEVPNSSEVESASSEARAKDGWDELDFENIYKYLSKIAKGGELPKLSNVESAVILCLLHSLPDQLQTLDNKRLTAFLRQTYSRLTEIPKSKESDNTEDTEGGTTAGWKDLKFCPLNPFLMPLSLLRQKEKD
ncbi:snRNA-activating protein complex subunit 2 [Rhinophrynus dorsalis]